MGRRVLAAVLLVVLLVAVLLVAGREAQSQSEEGRTAMRTDVQSQAESPARAEGAMSAEEWGRLSYAEMKAGLEDGTLKADMTALVGRGRGGLYARLLLKHGADPNGIVRYREDHALPVMHHMMLNGRIDIMKILVAHGADIDFVDDSSGTTPFLYAGLSSYRDIPYRDVPDHQYKKILRFFADNGADVNAVSNSGFSILDYLVGNCRDELIRYAVMDMGIDPNHTIENLGLMALSNPGAVSVLLKLGGEVDAEVLYFAVMGGVVPLESVKNMITVHGSADTVFYDKTLLQAAQIRAKGDVWHFDNIKSMQGDENSCDPLAKPLDYEEWKAGGQEIVEYLESLGAGTAPAALAGDYDFHLMKGHDNG